MDIPLLQTKLHVPPLRSEIVPRPRLVEQFNEGLRAKLVLVSAPAGFGKTTVVCEWLINRCLPVGWVSLDEADNDMARFWSYVIASLQTVEAGIGKSALNQLQSARALPVESILTTILNEMSKVHGEYVLVLDDYHTIKDQSVHDSLLFLLDHLPQQAHLIIVSRIDPPIPLANLRAQNQLIEIRAADLRFIQEETAAFLNDIMSLGLSDEHVAELESRTEGWIASLQLAALSIRDRQDIPAFIEAFNGSNRYILDYLIEEVLRKQDPETQSFLLETAVLDRFTADLCNAITMRNDSREILEYLDRSNLFVLPLDGECQWYRYHHLFADLLRNQLLLSHREKVPELHLRAGRWLEQEGFIDEAIGHTLKAEDFERAVTLIETVARQTVTQGHCASFLDWIEKLPRDLVVTRPWLCFYSAVANQLTGHRDAIEPLLQSAESAMAKAEKEQPETSFPDHFMIRSFVITIRTAQALFEGNLQRSVALCNEALQYLPEEAVGVRATVIGNLGITQWRNGDLPAARRYLEQAETLGRTSGNYYISLLAVSHLSEIHRIYGNLNEAARKCREAIRLSKQWGDGDLLPATGGVCLGLSLILYEWNNLDEAVVYVNQGIKLAEKSGEKSTLLLCCRMLAWEDRHQRDTGSVREAVRRADELSRNPDNPHIIRHAAASQARLNIVQGDLNAAEQWTLNHEPDMNVADVPDFWSEIPCVTLIRLRIAQGNVDELPDLLDRLLQKVESEQRTGTLIELLILRSIVHQALGETNPSLATLERALTLAEPEGFIRTFLDEGEPLIELLRLAVSRGIVGDYAQKLLDAYRPGTEAPSEKESAERKTASSSLPKPLSKRELEVLQLITDGMSNRQIADELIISEGTVKTHINNIYAKLEVRSRTRAIARSRELNVL